MGIPHLVPTVELLWISATRVHDNKISVQTHVTTAAVNHSVYKQGQDLGA